MGKADRALELLRSISTADTRWDAWEGPAWLARALLTAAAPGPEDRKSIDEAAGILEAVPQAARGTVAYLRAHTRLLEVRSSPPDELTRSQEALRAREAAEPSIREHERGIAATPWRESAPRRLGLARLYRSIGEPGQAVRHARLALAADPATRTPPSRSPSGWMATAMSSSACERCVRRSRRSPGTLR
jgi:hypothetical protein